MLIKFNELLNALKQFDENGKLGESGKWKIANGGYDLWFEVYYEGYTVLQCIDGELRGGFRPIPEFNDDIEKELVSRIIQTYPDVKKRRLLK